MNHTIECSVPCLDACFHPTLPHLMAVACVDGTMEMHDITDMNDDDDTLLASVWVHTQLIHINDGNHHVRPASCRCLAFTKDGAALVTAGSAGDLVVLQATQLRTFDATLQVEQIVACRIEHAVTNTKLPISCLMFLDDPNDVLVAGDESGAVTVWQWDRHASMLYQRHRWQVQHDYITGLVVLPTTMGGTEHNGGDDDDGTDHHHQPEAADVILCASSSADGTLAVYNVSAVTMSKKSPAHTKTTVSTSSLPAGVVAVSDPQDDELLSLVVMKRGHKIVAGSHQGALIMWSRHVWGDCSDRLPLHVPSLDGLCRLDDDRVLVGGADGMIRLVHIHPNQVCGVVGVHVPVDDISETKGAAALNAALSRGVQDALPIEKIILNADGTVAASLSHDEHIALWPAHLWSTNVMVAAASSTAAVMPKEQEKDEDDDDWEDMDAGDDDDDSMEDDDDSDNDVVETDKRKTRLPTDNEKFFADL